MIPQNSQPPPPPGVYVPPPRRVYTPPPRQPQSPLSVVITLIIGIIIAGALIGGWVQSHQQVQVTTCNPALTYCTQTDIPVVQQQQP